MRGLGGIDLRLLRELAFQTNTDEIMNEEERAAFKRLAERGLTYLEPDPRGGYKCRTTELGRLAARIPFEVSSV